MQNKAYFSFPKINPWKTLAKTIFSADKKFNPRWNCCFSFQKINPRKTLAKQISYFSLQKIHPISNTFKTRTSHFFIQKTQPISTPPPYNKNSLLKPKSIRNRPPTTSYLPFLFLHVPFWAPSSLLSLCVCTCCLSKLHSIA